MEKQEIKSVWKRLKYISGTAKGIITMFLRNRTDEEIYIQLLALRGGINSLIDKKFDDYTRKKLALQINQLLQKFPTDSYQHRRLIFIRKQFPNLDLKKVCQFLTELQKMDS